MRSAAKFRFSKSRAASRCSSARYRGGRNAVANDALVAIRRSSRNLPRQHSPAMHRQDRRESLASELPDHIDDPGLVAGMPDQATQVRCVELTVCAWRSLDLIEQFTLFWINCPFWGWSGFRARRCSRCSAPPTHEAEQEACRNPAVASRPVEREEAIPDHLRVDVPAG